MKTTLKDLEKRFADVFHIGLSKSIEIMQKITDKFLSSYVMQPNKSLYKLNGKYFPKFTKNGNIKTGKLVWTFSTLYSDEEFYIPELDLTIRGTCAGFCYGCRNSCYVAKSYKRYTCKETGKCSVKLGHAINTWFIRNMPEITYNYLYNSIKNAKNKPSIIRVNASGETESYIYFEVFNRLAKEFPNINFYVYTKNYLMACTELLSGNVADNFTVLISVWHENGVKEFNLVKHLNNVKCYAYMDKIGYDYNALGLVLTTDCHAYDSKGKMNHNITCDKCQKCFNRLESCKAIFCYDHK